MRKKIIGILILLSPLAAFAQHEEATTSSGKIVLLSPNGTWKLKVQIPDSTELQSNDSTYIDTLAIRKPEIHKDYSDTSTGFRGFLRPELKLPVLPDQSEGLYEFRVKVNKEGFVKEVVTIKRANNGQAESIMRNTIAKLKYKPNGSIVPPLTDGIIRILVPPGK